MVYPHQLKIHPQFIVLLSAVFSFFLISTVPSRFPGHDTPGAGAL